MPIDPYSACPGGTGKKIKFCCSDLVAELDKIEHMIQGEQRVACLDYVDKLLAKYPHRACLLSTKATLHADLDQPDKAKQALHHLLSRHPENPVGLAELAMLKVEEGGGQAGIEPLQRALAACPDAMPQQVYQAISFVAQRLLEEGQVVAARGHLLLMASIGGVDHEPAIGALMQVNGMAGVPLTVKQVNRLVSCPPGASYQRSFDAAVEAAMRGCWLVASEKFYELASRVGDQPAIWANVATLRGWLGDSAGAARALRKLAAQKTPLDDAVEAEALAQWLESQTEPGDEIDAVKLTFPVADHERLAELLASSPRIVPIPIDPARVGENDEPPPRGLYSLLDRPMPATGVGIARDAVPLVVGDLLWFGKQTDRAERLELMTYRDGIFARASDSLREALGPAIGAADAEEVVSKVDAVASALNVGWRAPDDTPPEHRDQLASEQHEVAIVENWPRLKLRLFGGKSAEEVAADPKERIKLLAAILNLELLSSAPEAPTAAAKLRERLGLPQPAPVDATGVDISDIPLSRLSRLDVRSLSTPALGKAFARATITHADAAIRALGRELVERTDVSPRDLKLADVYATLAKYERSSQTAVALLDRAREVATRDGDSTAPYDLSELHLHLMRFDLENARRLLEHIQVEHLREPGVAYALRQMMASLGIGGDDRGGAGRAQPQPVAAAPVADAAEPARIWTPGGQPAAAASKKSAIWTPDLD